ncbi:SDR family oxidoreductase [Mucilaginibacter sp. UR6-1]|uniref:SDR family oxidoreductase n=1 Tax=Mucilaginibacter sp. UR6-1 TaxID=1435643 RepID=UPI001E3B460B|nr:SDR family oxidoreductase [Mucilaginibacter sp. UR6-1]MCC8411245.1 SDR family oxidoreductase [Mucilaginibacter sp. UR6-1]
MERKVVVITGASSGVGAAAALEFAQYNNRLVLAARNEHALEKVAAECRELGSEVLVVITDVTDSKAVINLANVANDYYGRVDVWINNAGVLGAGNFETTPMDTHEQIIRTNLLGYMHGAHAILPIYKAKGKGIIINNISIGGFLPVPYGAGYTASKFGLRGFSESLKSELKAWPGIHVCDLFPAFLDTPGIYHAANYTGKELKPAPPVYDPVRVARAMVQLSIHPKSNTYVGSASLLLKFAHAIAPETTTNITGWVMRRYFKTATDIALTDGNTYNTVDFGTGVHGGFNLPIAPKQKRNLIAGSVLAGFAATWLLLRK